MIYPVPDAKAWVRRTIEARDRLVAEFGYRADDFVVVDEVLRADGISLGWWPGVYPSSWQDHPGWIADEAYPIGLVLHWPSGTDMWGEAHDAQDPIYILSEAEFWSTITPEDVKAMLA